MRTTFLLKTENAERLYTEAARDLPIIDFHNHVAVADLKADRHFEDLAALWLAPDPYKHRLMRIGGIPEQLITGDADPFQKFEQYCTLFPYLAGNPVYDWSRMELADVFGIDEVPSKTTAKYIWDAANEKLRSPEFSANGILSRFSVEYQSPVAGLTDDLSVFENTNAAPSLRGDTLLTPDAALYAELTQKTGKAVTDIASYLEAVCILLDGFDKAGCRFADHSLDTGFFETDTDGQKTALLIALGTEYAKRGWTLLLHVGAKRKTSPRLERLAGPAGGYAAVGEGFPIGKLCDLLRAMEQAGGLPNVVLFPLNMSDQAPLAVMQGSFSEDHVASKVQLGPAWWWCDHAFGIHNTLSSIASFGAVSQFIGMTTDSRSLLSFVRHDYFRRLLCSWLDRQNTEGEWELPFEVQADIVRKISYQNAKDKLSGGI